MTTREEFNEEVYSIIANVGGHGNTKWSLECIIDYANTLEEELKALQQRSCEECVHRSFIDEALTNKVTNGFCIENGFFTKRDFCCNRYEAKEQ